MASLKDQILVTADLRAYTQNRHGLPSRDTFVAFIVDRLCTNSPQKPTTASLNVTRDSKHVFEIAGSVMVADEEKQIEGHVHWLPKLDCFRGHINVDPEGRVNQLLSEDADNVRLLQWCRTKWHGDDHDHCRLCMATLSEHPSDAAFNVGYTAEDSGWLCPNCYNDVVAGGGIHPWLKPTSYATEQLREPERRIRRNLKSTRDVAARLRNSFLVQIPSSLHLN